MQKLLEVNGTDLAVPWFWKTCSVIFVCFNKTNCGSLYHDRRIFSSWLLHWHECRKNLDSDALHKIFFCSGDFWWKILKNSEWWRSKRKSWGFGFIWKKQLESKVPFDLYNLLSISVWVEQSLSARLKTKITRRIFARSWIPPKNCFKLTGVKISRKYNAYIILLYCLLRCKLS